MVPPVVLPPLSFTHARTPPRGVRNPFEYSRAVTFAERLRALCAERRSHLCVGLDPELSRLPAAVRGQADPVFAFNKAIVDATLDIASVYKPNFAFYEALGLEGWTSLKRTVEYIDQRAIVLA